MDFSSITIDDDLLANLLEFPTDAFELVFDKTTNQKSIQLKKSFSKMLFEGCFIFQSYSFLNYFKIT